MRRSNRSIGAGRLLFVIIFLSAVPISAEAYVGPGLGPGVVTSILGLLGALGTLFLGAIWYPLKKLLKEIRLFFGK